MFVPIFATTIPNEYSYGAAICIVGDVDGDGTADFAVSDNATAGVKTFVDLRSGLSSCLLWRRSMPTWSQGFAILAAAGDVNGDRIPDILTSSYGGNGVSVISGVDGMPIRVFAAPASSHQFGHPIAGGSDFNGDGVPDILIGDPGPHWRCDSHIYVRSGYDGSLFHDIAIDGDLNAVTTGFDANADGVPDIGVLADAGSVTVYSGTNAEIVPHRHMTSPLRATKSHARGTIFEVEPAVESESRGQVALLDPEAGSGTLSLCPVVISDRRDALAAVAGDLDGDGVSDIIVGARTTDPFFSGEVSAWSGRDSQRLWLTSGLGEGDFGATMAADADFDGDGYPDVLAGAVALRCGMCHRGSVWAISGHTGKALWSVERDSP